ncbi:protein O-mannosyltransferase 1 [Trichonephila clavipes]|nr:protein O-mannosyltransferase 1 [Trichonephila clavipes]
MSDDDFQPPSAFFNTDVKPPSFQFEIDAAAVIMLVLAVCTRMWRLEEPRSIVFDELHYGKFASMYMRRTFFFDSHPPLGKQLVALADYSETVPIRALRAVPAFFGSLLIPTVYYLVIELGFTSRTAMLAGILIIFEIVGSSGHEKVPMRGKPGLERPGRPRGERIEGSCGKHLWTPQGLIQRYEQT